MSGTIFNLQGAVRDRLIGDSGLLALLGGERIYDDVPQASAFPYVSFGPASVRDWSTGSETGLEHQITLNVWSRYAGKSEAFAILDAIRGLLHEAQLSLSGDALVNLRNQSLEVRRDEDGETYHGVIRFRAVTETNG